jgi:hypothetical protein
MQASAMLEPVALHQTGFKVPGLAQDGRGVVVGTQAALLLLGSERLVAVLRLLSEEAPLEDVLPSLHVEQVRNPLGAQAYLVRFACADSLLLDRWARAARLGGATLLVGADKHLVPYRDRRAPLGYDARALYAGPATGDYILYNDTAAQPFSRVREVALQKLVAQLPLLPTPGGAAQALRALGDGGAAEGAVDAGPADPQLTEPLWLSVPAGLLPRIARYLWERGARAEVATPDPLPAPTDRPLADPAEAERALLHIVHARVALLARLLTVPGLHFYRNVTPAVGCALAVELGYTHPMRLAPLVGLFARDKVYLFAGRQRGYEAVAMTHLVPLERLVELRPEGVAREAPSAARPGAGVDGARSRPRELVRTPLRLLPAASGVPHTPTATLIPWTHTLRLGLVLYALPMALLGGLQAACIDEGILVVGEGAHALPHGALLYEPTPGVFVPLGSELQPRLPGKLLAELLGDVSAQPVLLLPAPSGSTPRAVAVARSAFQPLSQQLLAAVVPMVRSGFGRSDPEESDLRYAPVSALSTFALWPLWGRLADEDE